MRTFIVLCLLAVTSADKLGYDYKPVQHSDAGLSFLPGSLAALPAAVQAAAHAAGPSNLVSSSFAGLGAGSAPSYGAPGTYSAPALAPAQAPAPASASLAPGAEYEKEFFSFSAPQEQEDYSGLERQLESALKKNLRVIFIKGPENQGLENAAINLAQHAAEQQTAIYVLQKQPDLGQLANKLNSVNNVNNQKPEVHFVKYRTPEDAANAQRAIQAQYDQLGGSSLSHNGGVAPVLNFASPAGLPSASAQEPHHQYLPASVFVH